MPIGMHNEIDKNLVMINWHALLFVMPVCALMINRRSRTGLLRLLFRLQSWVYGFLCIGGDSLDQPAELARGIFVWPFKAFFYIWSLLKRELMAGASKRSMIVKSVSQVFGQASENRRVVPFSDDKQFNVSGRIPAYALMERRNSKHAVSGYERRSYIGRLSSLKIIDIPVRHGIYSIVELLILK